MPSTNRLRWRAPLRSQRWRPVLVQHPSMGMGPERRSLLNPSAFDPDAPLLAAFDPDARRPTADRTPHLAPYTALDSATRTPMTPLPSARHTMTCTNITRGFSASRIAAGGEKRTSEVSRGEGWSSQDPTAGTEGDPEPRQRPIPALTPLVRSGFSIRHAMSGSGCLGCSEPIRAGHAWRINAPALRVRHENALQVERATQHSLIVDENDRGGDRI